MRRSGLRRGITSCVSRDGRALGARVEELKAAGRRRRCGDVIAFRPEADLPMITHRVVAIERDASGPTFITQADANDAPDRNPVAARRALPEPCRVRFLE